MIESRVAIIPQFRLFAFSFATWTSWSRTVEPGELIQGAQGAGLWLGSRPDAPASVLETPALPQ